LVSTAREISHNARHRVDTALCDIISEKDLSLRFLRVGISHKLDTKIDAVNDISFAFVDDDEMA